MRGSTRLEYALTVAAMVVFVLSSLSRLDLPFFWDASWVYAPAVYEMHSGVPSLIPGSIPPELSRGHPLMFFFLAGLWAKLFGFSAMSLHIFALIVSMAVLWMVFLLAKALVSRKAGLIAVVVCLSQEIFLAQSLLLLPEMLLTLGILGAIYCFVERKRWGYVIVGTAALLTKETGVVLIATLGIVYVLEYVLVKKQSIRKSAFWLDGLWISSPVFVASSHYLIQKIRYGWFFFPEHMGYQNKEMQVFVSKIREIFDLIAEDQMRHWLTLAVLIVTIIWFGRKQWWKGVLLLLGLGFLYQLFYHGFGLGNSTMLAGTGIGIIVFFVLVILPFWRKHLKAGEGMTIILLYAFLFILFTGYNFLTARYILNVISLFAVLAGVAFSRLVISRWMYLPVIIFPLLLLFLQLRGPSVPGDTRLAYADGVRIFQHVVEYFSQDSVRPCRVMATLLELRALTDPRACYVDNPVVGVDVTIHRNPEALKLGEVDFLVNTNFIEPMNPDQQAPGTCIKVDSMRIGHAAVDIYRVIKPVTTELPE